MPPSPTETRGNANPESPLAVVTAYEPERASDFRRMKRAKWAKSLRGLRGEWRQSPYHNGIVAFSLRSTEDERVWALISEGFPRKIEAVSIAARTVCVEEIAAEMMQVVKDMGGSYVDAVDDYGDLEPAAFGAYRSQARDRSRQRKEQMLATRETTSSRRSASVTPPKRRSRRAKTSSTSSTVKTHVPVGATYLFGLRVYVDLDTYEFDSFHIHRSEEIDTLWQTTDGSNPHAIGAFPQQGSLEAAGLRLMREAMRRRFGFPAGGFVAGLLDEKQVLSVHEQAQQDGARARDLVVRTTGHRPIVVLARELGLSPYPSDTGPASWYANCPSGRQHHVLIHAESGEFGCGYCGRKGGVEELREFAEERRAPKRRKRGT